MEPYYCSCLNIVINVSAGGNRTVFGKDFILDADDENGENIDSFFKEELLEVQLAVSGIEVSQSVMVKERCFGDWLIYNCLNCGCDSHAVHAVKGVERVLMASQLDHGNEFKETKKQGSNYSSIFKLLLTTSPKKFHPTSSVILQQKYVGEAKEKIENFVKILCKTEEDAMNERIRIYTEQQKQNFMEFKRKGIKDKEILMKTLNQYEVSNESLFDSINESYFGAPLPESRDLTTDLPQIKARPLSIKITDSTDASVSHSLPNRIYSPGKPRSPFKRNARRTKSNSSQSSMHSRTFSDIDDTLFDLEGFHDSKSCEPFYESDDDSSGDATSLESSGGFGLPPMRGLALNPGDRVYATSVPVEIPLFQNTRNSYELESEDEKDEPSPSPGHIADSIKALAKSMQDSTGMFGELPRPRLNTTPYSMKLR